MLVFRKIPQAILISGVIALFTFCSTNSQENADQNKKNPRTNQTEKAAPPTNNPHKKEIKTAKEVEVKNTQTQLWDSGNTDMKYNQIARFIAGMPQIDTNSPLKKYEENTAWKNYAAQSNARWNTIMTRKIPKMTQWRNEELKALTQEGGFLFYPFSGADFLHVGIFFPTLSEIVMIGLEPIGTVPDIEKIARSSFQYYFNGLNRSLATVLEYSFFRTLDMQVDLTGKVNVNIDGTLPLIMLFMVRTNHTILDIEKVAIGKDGKMVAAQSIKNPQGVLFGNKISYRRDSVSNERKNLYYFSADISDAGLNNKPHFLTFLQSLKINTTYIKSASYLMYNASFSKIKNIILTQTKYHLQDDSGIPFASFKKNEWDFIFFGRYIGPIQLFAGRWQNDLAAAFKDKNSTLRPLPFGIGYQFVEGNSNLMLAIKKPKQ
ncbi:MAG: hypothetical protein NZ551_03050 [Microscillaceae bacterium]|nr:hypothetical protein [Microscillaceae bacterium]MDW8460165.1 hypothetical protein [Cytophagales bacterium]